MFEFLGQLATLERKEQLFIRNMANGVLSERDRLLEYTIGEFYTDFSLFITESELRKKELDELKAKR